MAAAVVALSTRETCSIDEVLDQGARLEEALVEGVEVEVVRLAEEAELPRTLGCKYGLRAATETAVVDSGDAGGMVRELFSDIRTKEEAGPLFRAMAVAGPRVFSIHYQKKKDKG